MQPGQRLTYLTAFSCSYDGIKGMGTWVLATPKRT
jgi:hypothetical protein